MSPGTVAGIKIESPSATECASGLRRGAVNNRCAEVVLSGARDVMRGPAHSSPLIRRWRARINPIPAYK